MKRTISHHRLAMLLASLFFAATATACVDDASAEADSRTTGEESLLLEHEDGIAFMREEEKLARDLYLQLGEQWRHRSFDNISDSEQRHMNAMLRLLDRYGLDDPAADSPIGSFHNAELQSLYDELITRGESSLVDALSVGALIEEVDIVDLQARLADEPPEDVRFAYENLLRGSRNHLRAFVGYLEQEGVEHSPTRLDRESFDAIIESEHERGRGAGYGNGDGAGRGRGYGHGRGAGHHGRGGGFGRGAGFGHGYGPGDGTGPRAGTGDCRRD